VSVTNVEERLLELEEVRKEVRLLKRRGVLPPREAGLVEGFVDELSLVLDDLSSLEAEASARNEPLKLGDDPALSERFKDLYRRFIDVASKGPGAVSSKALELVNKAWGAGLRSFTSFLERYAHVVGVDSRSMGAAVGFPSGVTTTLTLSFKVRH